VQQTSHSGRATTLRGPFPAAGLVSEAGKACTKFAAYFTCPCQCDPSDLSEAWKQKIIWQQKIRSESVGMPFRVERVGAPLSLEHGSEMKARCPTSDL
jgi:hypothetical protein